MLFPGWVGFTQSPERFAREMRRMKQPVMDLMGSKGGSSAKAVCHEWVSSEGHPAIAIIAMPFKRDADEVEVAGLLAHESVHAMQFLLEQVGETKPGRETEAYLTQSIFQVCFRTYLDNKNLFEETKPLW